MVDSFMDFVIDGLRDLLDHCFGHSLSDDLRHFVIDSLILGVIDGLLSLCGDFSRDYLGDLPRHGLGDFPGYLVDDRLLYSIIHSLVLFLIGGDWLCHCVGIAVAAVV